MKPFLKTIPFALVAALFVIALVVAVPRIRRENIKSPEGLQSELLGAWVASPNPQGDSFLSRLKRIEITKQSEGKGTWTEDYIAPATQDLYAPQGTQVFSYQIIGKDRVELNNPEGNKGIYSILFSGDRLKLNYWGDGSLPLEGPISSVVLKRE